MVDAIQSRLKEDFLRKLEVHFVQAFPGYQPDKNQIIGALKNLLQAENIHAALFPKKSLHKADVSSESGRVKSEDIPLEELNEDGVVTSYSQIKPDIYLHASLYLLPAAYPFAREASFHPEEYKEVRPHFEASGLCKVANGHSAFYAKVSAFNLGGEMVVETPPVQNGVGDFHLAPECKDRQGHVYKADNVLRLDGVKIYQPVLVPENDTLVEKTMVLSATIVVWGSVTGWAMAHLGSEERHAQGYGLASLSEVLAVLKRLSTQ